MLWSKLPDKEIDCSPHHKRVLRYDPSDLPNRINFQPYQRFQNVSMRDIFTTIAGFCSCGCGEKLSGRKTRWATEDCSNYAVSVWSILAGRFNTISWYLRKYYGWNCFGCGCKDKGHEMGANGTVAWIKVDHIIPVKNGGGACWLSNYQLLCHDCHVPKTNKDFGWKNKPSIIQMPTLF